MSLPTATGQGIRWCITVIHNQATNSKRKYIRWNRDVLLINKTSEDETEWGETIPCSKSSAGFTEQEMLSWLRTLPKLQYEVITGLYIDGLTQTEVSNRLNMSQQHVSRLKDKALRTLREDVVW